MSKIIFLVQGSGAEPYEVEFQKIGEKVIGRCTCPAAENGTYCKHRTRILKGDRTGIVSENAEQVDRVVSWAKDSPIVELMNQIDERELQVERIQKEIRELKKQLAKKMAK